MSTECFFVISCPKEGRLRVELDRDDYALYASFKWAVSKLHHVYRNYRKGRKIKKHYLARLIMHAREDETIRYRDGNPLNLTKANLVLLNNDTSRALTTEEEAYLRSLSSPPTRVEVRASKYVGVVACRHTAYWTYSLNKISPSTPGGIVPYISPNAFDTEYEAALAYDKALLAFYGDCPRTREAFVFNFPHLLPSLPGSDIDEF